MKFHILTIFPDILNSYLDKGMLRIAQEKKLISVKQHNLRDYAIDSRGTVDDKPYGGGPGQVMLVEPIYKALKQISARGGSAFGGNKQKIVLLSAKSKTWNQAMAKRYSKLDQVVFVCPRYEGHDERIKKFVDEEISIGDYVLTGGELGAAVIMDSITRLIPGVLGKQESTIEESHSTPGYLEYPQYTRPEIFTYKQTSKQANKKTITKNLKVPKILLSGHHAKIKEWRKTKSKQK
jgi:tRNA (guanine37-N1)-methyltransferase